MNGATNNADGKLIAHLHLSQFTRMFLLTGLMIAFLGIPATPCSAQKLKLPNLLPFKKREKPAPAFQTTNQSRSASKSRTDRSVFDFLNPRATSPEKQGPLADFNDRSREFFSKAGRGLTKFAEDTKDVLASGWRPPKAHTAWWNKGPKSLPDQALFQWTQGRGQPPELRPLLPSARMAEESQKGRPRHRFR